MNEQLHSGYPEPPVDEINREHVDAWRTGRLTLQHCRQCATRIFYPRPMCPACWSEDLEWVEADGGGTIESFSLVYRPNHEAFFDETPIVLAEVRLEEGVSMLARVVDADTTTLRTGMAVELLSGEAARRYPLPTFRPSKAALEVG